MASVIGHINLTCPACRTVVEIQVLGSEPKPSRHPSIANVTITIDSSAATAHVLNCKGSDLKEWEWGLDSDNGDPDSVSA